MTAPTIVQGAGPPAVYAPCEVTLVSGDKATVLTAEEADYFNRSRDAYLEQTRFTEQTDLADLDRLLTLELMVYRWRQYLFCGYDYHGDEVEDEKVLVDRVKYYCVDEDTEILTERGWMRYDQVIPGERVYTLNVETGVPEWQVPETLSFGRGHKMLRLQSRNHSSLTTPHHRWPVLQGGGRSKQPQWRMSEELNTGSWLITAVDPAPQDPVHADAFVELVGWYWTEGTVTFKRGRPAQAWLSQSEVANPEHCERIRATLTALYGAPGPMRQGARWNERRRADGVILFALAASVARELQCAAPGSTKVLDATFLRSLSPQQLDLLVQTSVAADGWVTKRGAVRLCQNSLARVRAFEMACALAGYPTTTRRRLIGDWEIGLLRCRRVAPVLAAAQGKGAVAEYVDNDGIFWCPTVANGTWLARRDGTVWWTGNSDQINKLKESMSLNKKARDDAANEGSFALKYADLKAKAKIFGIHRINQLTETLTLFEQLSWIVMSFYRSDEEERRKLGFESEAEIVQWVRDVALPEYRRLDAFFREHEQRYWIRTL